MAKNPENQNATGNRFKGIGMAVGLIFGGLVGLLIDNMIIFAGGGMVLGFALGTAIDRRI